MGENLKAFMLMPFDDKVAESLYTLCTKKVCKEFNVVCERSDEIITPHPIVEDIVKAIEEVNIIIADISGKNANVFYELGISHILKQNQTIIISRDDFEHTPFDIRHFRIIKYENTILGKENYEKELRTMLKNILRDYRVLYKNEYDILIHFISSGKQFDLIYLLTLFKSSKPIKGNKPLRVEGNYQGKEFMSDNASTFQQFVFWISLEYVKVSGDYLTLTDKGKVFAEILEEKGFVIDMINDEILTPGYIPFKLRHEKKMDEPKKEN